MGGHEINPVEGTCYSVLLGASRDMEGFYGDDEVKFRKSLKIFRISP